MKTLFLSAVASVAATSALANDPCLINPQSCTAVPEISALEGMAAVAALAAVVLLVWERRRRAA